MNFKWTSACVAGSLLLVAASAPALTQSAATSDPTSTSDGANPYAVITDRNVFHLNPLPKPKSDADQKPADLPKVSFNGIIHVGDDVAVLFSIPAKDPKGMTTYYKLAPGEKDDVLELLRIRPGEQEVDVLVDGTPVTLSVTNNSPEGNGGKGPKGPPPAIPAPPPPPGAAAQAAASSSSAIIVGGSRESRYGSVAVGGGGGVTTIGGDSGGGGVAVGGGFGSGGAGQASYGGGGYGGGAYGGVSVGGGTAAQIANTLISGNSGNNLPGQTPAPSGPVVPPEQVPPSIVPPTPTGPGGRSYAPPPSLPSLPRMP